MSHTPRTLHMSGQAGAGGREGVRGGDGGGGGGTMNKQSMA